MPTHGFAHVNNKKPIFDSKIRVFLGDIGIIFNEFEGWFNKAIKIWEQMIWEENFKIPWIQPMIWIIFQKVQPEFSSKATDQQT